MTEPPLAQLAKLLSGVLQPPQPTPTFTDPRFREERPPEALDLLLEALKGAIGIGGQQPIGSNLDRAQAGGEMLSMASVPLAGFRKLKGDTLSGLKVRPDIPNTGSISASFDDYENLGLRSVPVKAFEDSGPPKFYSASEQARTERLAGEISSNKEINPLIVAIDEKGPYILEGAHRFDALKMMGVDKFPALVVREIVKKYGIAAALGAGLINQVQAQQLKEQGFD